MKIGVIRFPGSNCDWDIFHTLQSFSHVQIEMLWYQDQFQGSYELLILPGGFSYGDYLRAGAIARFAPAMESVRAHVARGGSVLGICNGFQILCESNFLPGALLPNQNLKHICRDVELYPNTGNRFAAHLEETKSYRIPVSHSDGNFYIDDEQYKILKDQNQIVFTYEDNPNGSVADIAGISDSTMRILGMMPHPERAADSLLRGIDGRSILQSILNAI